MAIHHDPDLAPRELLDLLYAGDLVVLTGLPAVGALVDLAREELTALFAPDDPEHAHEQRTPADLAAVLGAWKPRFMRDPEVNRLVRSIVEQAGLDPSRTHYDMPKPRTSFPVGHLTTGVAFAFPWHRDTWYGAPRQQVNWWLPVSRILSDNAMGFDLASFDRSVANDSAGFDYYALNANRSNIAAQVTRELQARPSAPGHAVTDEVVVLPEPGSILLFSGAHLHRSIPNTSGRARFSIDFRTVDVDDLVADVGAPAVDVECTGTSIRDFRNVSDGEGFEEGLVEELFGPPPPGAVLTYEPPG